MYGLPISIFKFELGPFERSTQPLDTYGNAETAALRERRTEVEQEQLDGECRTNGGKSSGTA